LPYLQLYHYDTDRDVNNVFFIDHNLQVNADTFLKFLKVIFFYKSTEGIMQQEIDDHNYGDDGPRFTQGACSFKDATTSPIKFW
jgi:hypothetical protein